MEDRALCILVHEEVSGVAHKVSEVMPMREVLPCV